jgi:hypothetical protein
MTPMVADGGLRARPGPGLRRALQGHWGLGGSAEAVDLGGSSSLNLLVGDADRRYVVRVHRFMGERARIDDLALTLHCARSDLDVGGGPVERAQLGRLVASYDAGLDLPLSESERAALPLAIACQPLASIGGWVARLDDQAAARRHAASMGPELAAARQLMTELGRWQDAFA